MLDTQRVGGPATEPEQAGFVKIAQVAQTVPRDRAATTGRTLGGVDDLLTAA